MGIPSFSIAKGESQLIQRAKEGEKQAFGALYDHYGPRIYRFAFLKTGTREEAEDITHQVFLKAFESISSYEDMGYPFSSWLYQIARNRITDFYRTAKHDISLENADPEYFIGTASVSDMLETKMEVGKVTEALKSLKPEHQDVVIMRFVEELSLKETAEVLQKSVGAVKLIQHRAVQELRNALGDRV